MPLYFAATNKINTVPACTRKEALTINLPWWWWNCQSNRRGSQRRRQLDLTWTLMIRWWEEWRKCRDFGIYTQIPGNLWLVFSLVQPDVIIFWFAPIGCIGPAWINKRWSRILHRGYLSCNLRQLNYKLWEFPRRDVFCLLATWSVHEKMQISLL